MLHFIETSLLIIFFGGLGILLRLWIRAVIYFRADANVTSRMAWQRIIKKEWGIYIPCLILLFICSVTHDEWLPWISMSKYTADTLISEFSGRIKLLSAGGGLLAQHFICMAAGSKFFKR